MKNIQGGMLAVKALNGKKIKNVNSLLYNGEFQVATEMHQAVMCAC